MSRASMNARSPSLDRVADEQLVDPVGQPPRVEAVLERPAAVVEPGSHQFVLSSVLRRPAAGAPGGPTAAPAWSG